jgi:hypothetical protein
MKSWGGQWEPEFPNSSQNNASEMWDYRSGGPGGVVQAPGANYKSTSLQHQAGIINWFFDKIYDQMKKREQQDGTAPKWWLPETENNNIQGPEHTEIQQAQVHHGSLTDNEWDWHFTASWLDVQAKARKIKREGHVKILEASNIYVVGEVQGDTAVYESQLNYVPGTKKVADWACGCKWASYSWGRSKPFSRFEGRLCSHALALQYEAGARGMFGKEVGRDTQLPDWQKAHQPVVVEYDKRRDKDLTRRVVPPGNMKRTFSASLLDSDEIYVRDHGLDLQHPPIYASMVQMVAHDEPLDNVIEFVASYRMDKDLAESLLFEALSEASDLRGRPVLGTWSESASELTTEASKQHKRQKLPIELDHHKAEDARKHAPNFGYGFGRGNFALMWCPQCLGSGCGHCAGMGQVPADEESHATEPPTSNTPDENPDSGPDISGDMSVGASIHTADYSSAGLGAGMRKTTANQCRKASGRYTVHDRPS